MNFLTQSDKVLTFFFFFSHFFAQNFTKINLTAQKNLRIEGLQKVYEKMFKLGGGRVLTSYAENSQKC